MSYSLTPKWQKGVTHLHLWLVTVASVYCSLLTSTSVFNCSSEVLVLHLNFLLLHNATALVYILEGNAFLKMLNFLETQNYFIKYNKNTSVVKKKKEEEEFGQYHKVIECTCLILYVHLGNKDSDGKTYTT